MAAVQAHAKISGGKALHGELLLLHQITDFSECPQLHLTLARQVNERRREVWASRLERPRWGRLRQDLCILQTQTTGWPVRLVLMWAAKGVGTGMGPDITCGITSHMSLLWKAQSLVSRIRRHLCCHHPHTPTQVTALPRES